MTVGYFLTNQALHSYSLALIWLSLHGFAKEHSSSALVLGRVLRPREESCPEMKDREYPQRVG